MKRITNVTNDNAMQETMNNIERKLKEMLKDKDNFLSNLYVGLQKDSTEPIVKDALNELDGIEKYMYIRIKEDNDIAHCKVKEKVLTDMNISIEDAWEHAHHNTDAEALIVSIRKKMAEMIGMEFDDDTEEAAPMYIITNNSNIRGSSAILNKKMLKEFAKKMNVDKLIVLPSSVHEMLLIPFNNLVAENFDIDELNSMVSSVNATEVAPKERLTDIAYILEV